MCPTFYGLGRKHKPACSQHSKSRVRPCPLSPAAPKRDSGRCDIMAIEHQKRRFFINDKDRIRNSSLSVDDKAPTLSPSGPRDRPLGKTPASPRAGGNPDEAPRMTQTAGHWPGSKISAQLLLCFFRPRSGTLRRDSLGPFRRLARPSRLGARAGTGTVKRLGARKPDPRSHSTCSGANQDILPAQMPSDLNRRLRSAGSRAPGATGAENARLVRPDGARAAVSPPAP